MAAAALQLAMAVARCDAQKGPPVPLPSSPLLFPIRALNLSAARMAGGKQEMPDPSPMGRRAQPWVLATLCNVDACVVVYGEGESQPKVWLDAPKVAQVLAFNTMPELDQCKKMMDMEGFLNQRIDKLEEQPHKAQCENRERETTLLLHDAIAGRRPGLSVEIACLGWPRSASRRLLCDAARNLSLASVTTHWMVRRRKATLRLQWTRSCVSHPPFSIT
ncbi:uncharacterized protein [Miscanthus floridulus]|uniref:uncharacterized protein n=1 Tax=Miscanthus floridulus TaxID=154761 RepID=UPI003457EC37